MSSVSVCLGFHNGEKFLREQIDSIRSQLGPMDEIVCSDDNSTDMSRSILESYGDKRIKVISAPFKNSHIRNFEYALSCCKGDLIFLSDQDDLWEPEKVANLKFHLQSYDLVLTDCSVVDKEGNELHNSFFRKHASGKGIIRNILRNSYMGCCMAFHRRIIERVLPFPENIAAHDQWIGLVAEKYYKVMFLPTKLVRHRRHEGNLSSTTGRSRRSLGEKLLDRYTLLKNLTIR